MTDTISIIANVVTTVAALGSLATLLLLFQRHIGGRPLLEYEPRRPVPWNFLAPALMLAPGVMALISSRFANDPSPTAPGEPLTSPHLWQQVGAMLTLTLVFQGMLAIGFRANWIDLGLPQSWRQFFRDVRIGTVTFLAALLPVYAIQFALIVILEPQEGHPLIEELQVRHSPQMMIAAMLTVVVAAPLSEETTFRVVLQGWLERVEDLVLGWRKRVEGATVGPVGTEPQILPPGAGGAVEAPTPTFEEPAPPVMGALPGLHYGWAPVLASAAAFAMAHLGHGVAPVSLLPLGVALGYVYQRTHRIVPSMVCHGLFNGFSMTTLWLTLPAPGQ
jgi:membrane protease YdiL (CAAX protease family)